MSYHTECDWCGAWLGEEADQATMRITIYHRGGRGTLDAKWAEETGVTRHFCAAPSEDTYHGHNRMGLVPDAHLDCCYERAIAAITGTKLAEPGLGMEWRLVGVSDAAEPPHTASKPAPKVPPPLTCDSDCTLQFAGKEITAELHEVIETRLATSYWYALPAAGIVSLDQVAAMTDDELLAIDRVGHGTVKALRQAIRERRGYDGLALAREVLEVLQEGLARIGELDPTRPALTNTLPALTAALAGTR
jgi:hypothetical protein